MGAISPMHLIIVLVVVLVLFGPSQLPKLGKSIGQTMKSVRQGMDEVSPKSSDDEE